MGLRPPRTRSSRAALSAAAAFLILLLPAALSVAQDNDECLACHEDSGLTGERDGRETSVHVDAAEYGASVHGGLDCVQCHQDLAGADLPHDDDLAPVDCAVCHGDQVQGYRRGIHGVLAGRGAADAPGCAGCHGRHDVRPAAESAPGCAACHASQASEHGRSLHGIAEKRGDEMAPRCATCHGGHEILPASDPKSPTAVLNVPLLCGRCHREGSPVSLTHEIPQDRVLENYSMSIHGQGLFEKGLTVTAVCTSCHTSHLILPHTDRDSSIHAANVAGTCLKCHGQIEQVHRKVIEGRLWEEEPHKIPACVDCHSPHKIRRVFYETGMANKDCLRCHADPNLTMTRDGETISLYVDDAAYGTSAHSGTACAQCHTEVKASRERSCETIVSPVDCGICHAGPVDDYRISTHGTLAARGDRDAPTCLDCHSKHATGKKTWPASPTFARNVPALCGKCHREGQQAAVRIESDIPDIMQGYIDSIHGKGLLQSGLLVTATCASCHSPHRELPPGDPRSTVHHDNVAATCGQCHHGIEETFRKSVHWPEDPAQQQKLPTCSSCHTSHTISRADVGDFRFLMMDQCGRCHEVEAETFFDTFHGKVSRLGSSGAAKCYDCHGTHDILPPSDPASTLSRDNVVQTCSSCHEGSHRRFAGYLTHATHHDKDKYPWLFWSFWFMTVLLVGTLTFALIHTFAWLIRLWLTRDEWKAHRALAHAGGDRLYRRFSVYNRTLHFLMILSFFTLGSTGMALKFSYTGWAQWFAWIMGGFETTGVLHRMGGVTLFVVFFAHLRDLWKKKKKGRKSWMEMITGPNSILFNPNDIREAGQSIRWFFGVGPRPRYGRFTYWEKFDYFAVFWGVMVIGSTGLLLWFPELFTRILPGWSVNVATIIHSDEALLAVGFIFTIHFFNTHFRPDKFPMDPVIFTGRVSLEELKYDKPREYEAMEASGELQERLVRPYPRQIERAFKIFGFSALAFGLTLVGLIVYAMLFGYR